MDTPSHPATSNTDLDPEKHDIQLLRRRESSLADTCCLLCVSSCASCCTFLCWALTFAPLGVFLWLCTRLALDPYERWINYSLPGSRAILAFSYIWGISEGLTVFCVLAVFGGGVFATGRRIQQWWGTFLILLSIAFLVVLSMSPHIAIRAAKTKAWPHQCNGSWIEVVLTGDHATSSMDFALAQTGQPLFTFTHTRSPEQSTSTVRLASVAEHAPVVPTLDNMQFDWALSTFSGNCATNSTDSCVSGTIASPDGANLVFDIGINGTRSVVRGNDRVWSFDSAPLLDLRDSNDPSKVILQTAMHRCPRMKVCVPSSSSNSNTLARTCSFRWDGSWTRRRCGQ